PTAWMAKRFSTRCVLPITPTTGLFIAEALDTLNIRKIRAIRDRSPAARHLIWISREEAFNSWRVSMRPAATHQGIARREDGTAATRIEYSADRAETAKNGQGMDMFEGNRVIAHTH